MIYKKTFKEILAQNISAEDMEQKIDDFYYEEEIRLGKKKNKDPSEWSIGETTTKKAQIDRKHRAAVKVELNELKNAHRLAKRAIPNAQKLLATRKQELSASASGLVFELLTSIAEIDGLVESEVGTLKPLMKTVVDEVPFFEDAQFEELWNYCSPPSISVSPQGSDVNQKIHVRKHARKIRAIAKQLKKLFSESDLRLTLAATKLLIRADKSNSNLEKTVYSFLTEFWLEENDSKSDLPASKSTDENIVVAKQELYSSRFMRTVKVFALTIVYSICILLIVLAAFIIFEFVSYGSAYRETGIETYTSFKDALIHSLTIASLGIVLIPKLPYLIFNNRYSNWYWIGRVILMLMLAVIGGMHLPGSTGIN